MNPSSRDGWPPSSAQSPGAMSRPNEPPPRASTQPSYGNNTSPHQQGASSAPVLPPPPGQFYHGPHSGPSLPSLAGINQPSPNVQPRSSYPGPEQHSPTHPQPVHPIPAGYGPAGGLSQLQPTANNQAPPPYETPRQMGDAAEREAHERDYEQSRRDAAQREADARERDRRERPSSRPSAPQNEPTPLHQPVAVGPQMRSAIHGPNGLLNGAQGAAGPPSNAPNPANVIYTGSPYDRHQPPGHQPPIPIQSVIPYPVTSPTLVTAGPHGQQPILNDALSYLDQVKVQFSGEPNVYNQFLDIMKDFKSQAIDTPGVIRRVSSLFSGNPSLIQGFNTFLPPGYKIECGTADDPNAIRVTTPMGTTVSPMGSTLRPPSRHLIQGEGAEELESEDAPRHVREGWGAARAQDPPGDSVLSPSVRHQPPPSYGSRPGQVTRMSPSDAHHAGVNAALLAHQQEQRGVSQLQNAVTAATASEPLRQSATPFSGLQNGHAMAQQGPGGDKRGPVEFNHAISYVNKIKNRFASQPEIYKQFLEILQTYQRESKPIQDVYAQVTDLFDGAPDLLEDFKQFLPESAAHAKAAAARQAAEDSTFFSNVRGDAGYGAGNLGPNQTPRADQRMPPLGTFATTPNARDGKRKRIDRQQPGGLDYGAAANKAGYQPHKRTKHTQMQQPPKYSMAPDSPVVNPTLIPALPEPMAPSTSVAATSDDLSFFDRVKKFIGNKNTMNEFLKLCNLYSMDLIDKNLLVHRAANFIGGNPELFGWFKTFLNYDGRDQIIENRARPAVIGRVNLNNCRSLGQSYREMPKRERMKPCSGRDELCKSVLNDQWVSHPTWASEDSGFIAHKKNNYEEALHRIEEERHDYDHHCAIIDRTIQILEPFANHNRLLPESDRPLWSLPPGYGGQCHPVIKKVLSKIYGRDNSQFIMEEMLTHPGRVIPVVLVRCRLIAEQWKASLREWEKIWRDQTQKMFWKSLDHQGQQAKQLDKRQFQTKTLQNEIHVKAEEQKRARLSSLQHVPYFQFKFKLDDKDVVLDATRIMVAFIEKFHSTDSPRLSGFIKEFMTLFFDIAPEKLEERLQELSLENTTTEDEIDDDAAPQASEDHQTRGRKMNGRHGDLLRGVLDRGRTRARLGADSGNGSNSRATTPDVTSVVDEQIAGSATTPESGTFAMEETAAHTSQWIAHAIEGNVFGRHGKEYKPNEPFKRHTYSLYANLPIYCFFRMFTILYERLENLKKSEQEVHEIVKRAKSYKAATDLRMIDKTPDSYFKDTSESANYYNQMLRLLEESVTKSEGSIDMSLVEDVLRRYYLQKGWLLYSFDKLLSALVRFAVAIHSNESKERSEDLLNLYRRDRKRESTTHKDELTYRRSCEHRIKEGEIYRILYDTKRATAYIRILESGDTTFDTRTGATMSDGLEDAEGGTPTSPMSQQARWSYYVSSYLSLAPTEGVNLSKLSITPLQRNLHTASERYGVSAISELAYPGPSQGTGSANGNKESNEPDIHSTDVEAVAGQKRKRDLADGRLRMITSMEAQGIRIGIDDYKLYWVQPKERQGQYHPSLPPEEEWWTVRAMPAQKKEKTTHESSNAEPGKGDGKEENATTGDEAGKEGNDEHETRAKAAEGLNKASESPETADDDASKALKNRTDGDGDVDMGMHEEKEGEGEPDPSESWHSFYEKYLLNNRWMAGLSRSEVEAKNRAFGEWSE